MAALRIFRKARTSPSKTAGTNKVRVVLESIDTLVQLTRSFFSRHATHAPNFLVIAVWILASSLNLDLFDPYTRNTVRTERD